jgi:hypothetical protein
MLFLNTEYTDLLRLMKITGISGVRVSRSLGFCVVFCRSFSVVFLWPLYCLSFDLLILIAPMVSIIALYALYNCKPPSLINRFHVEYHSFLTWRQSIR